MGIFVLTIPMIVYHDLNPFGPPELRHLLILRGLAGATSLFLRFVAFQNLPIADASVIIFSIPVFVSVFAWIFLKVSNGFVAISCFDQTIEPFDFLVHRNLVVCFNRSRS